MASSASQGHSRYRPEIDGLRAVAVVAVIVNHFHQELLPSGYLGVDVFFVISGYVITASLAARRSSGFADFITGFYERRIKRLLPALALFVLITGLATCLVNPEPDLSLKTGLAALPGLSNLYLQRLATDYFAPATELNSFTHTWSLGVEEQFYFVFPWLVWWSGFSQGRRHGAALLFGLVALLCLGSLVLFVHWYATNTSAAYFLMPARFWEMGAGCLAVLIGALWPRLQRFCGGLPALPLLLLVLTCFLLPRALAVGATVAVVALSSLLLLCLGGGDPAARWLSSGWLVRLGLMSYSLYLWHWGVLSISRWTIGIQPWTVPLQLLLMLALAWASYRWVEKPLRRAVWWSGRGLTLATGLLGLLGVSALMAGLVRWNANIYLGATRERELELTTRCFMDTPAAAEAFIRGSRFQECRLLPRAGPGAERPTHLFFLGDSFVNHHMELAQLLAAKGFAASIPSVGQTRYPLVRNYSGPLQPRDQAQQLLARSAIEQARSGDVVVLSSAITSDFSRLAAARAFVVGDDPEAPQLSRQAALARWGDAVLALARLLAGKGVRLVVMAPIPQFQGSLEVCDRQWFTLRPPGDCSVEREAQQQNFADLDTVMDRLEASGSVVVFRAYDQLCPVRNRFCSPFDGDKRLYRDAWHLSREGSRRLAGSFEAVLRRHGVSVQ